MATMNLNLWTAIMAMLPDLDQPLTFLEEEADQLPLLIIGDYIHLLYVSSMIILLIILFIIFFFFNRRRELELSSVSQQLFLALEAGEVSAWTYNVKKKWFTTLHRQTIARTGISFDQFAALIHPENREEFMNLFALMESGQLERGEQKLRFIWGGRYEWYESYLIAIKERHSNEVIEIIGTQRNITEKIKQQQELRENISKMELIIRSAEIIPWEYDIENASFYSPNQKAFKYRGLSFEEMRMYTLDEDKELLENSFNEMLTEGKSMNIRVRIQFPRKELAWYTIYAMTFEKDKNGKPLKVIGTSRDITQLIMTDELIELKKRAEDANRLKTAFLANMTHEIRTPLNAIVGFSNLIIESESKKEQLYYKEIVEMNNDLLLQVINDILDFAKIEADVVDFNFSLVELSHFFHKVFCQFKRKIPQGVVFQFLLPDKKCTIRTDEHRVTQIFANLLNNACKFTHKGEIVMGYTHVDSGLRFFVRDTGKGIMPEDQKQIFKQFYKLDPFSQGTGLGLTICKSLVEQMGGEIGVDSTPDKGTEFWFFLPCIPLLEDSSLSEETETPFLRNGAAPRVIH